MMRRLAVSLASLVAAGCATPRGELLVPPQPAIVWPRPPDAPRIQYIGELKGSDDLKPARSSSQVLGDIFHGPAEPFRLVTPHAVAVHPDGNRLAVADTNGACIHLFDLERREYARRESCGPSGARLECPVAVAWVNDVLWVADARLRAVAVLEPGRERLIGRDALRRPAGLAYSSEAQLCYVSDAEAHAILAFESDGTLAFQFGSNGAGPGQFNYPSQLACGTQRAVGLAPAVFLGEAADSHHHDGRSEPVGSLVVADSLNFRVQRLAPDGTPVSLFGRKGDAAGDLALPKGVAVSDDGNIWVVDGHFENVQGFTPSGELLLAFGREGQGPGEFWLPAGICIDSKRRLWVADTYNRRVQVFQLLP